MRRLFRAEEHSPVSQQRMETPPPVGFKHNRGVHYIPFQIRDAQGQLHPARYTQLVFMSDPFVLAYRRGSDQQYGKSVHAEPQYNESTPTYTNDDLVFLDQNSAYRESVDMACMAMNDLTITAKTLSSASLQVYSVAASSHLSYLTTVSFVTGKEEELKKKIAKLDKLGSMCCQCVLRLQHANAIKHIKDKRDSYCPGAEEGQRIAGLREEIVCGRSGA
ncbi:hypothetical protein EDB83DRAFT_2520493 [Lactarius deliciosus]|nr:hypothetical protein EDB83DRAFT_2520493 [Lactarius deliciosus]